VRFEVVAVVTITVFNEEVLCMDRTENTESNSYSIVALHSRYLSMAFADSTVALCANMAQYKQGMYTGLRLSFIFVYCLAERNWTQFNFAVVLDRLR
jgi:hypothetical protein